MNQEPSNFKDGLELNNDEPREQQLPHQLIHPDTINLPVEELADKPVISQNTAISEDIFVKIPTIFESVYKYLKLITPWLWTTVIIVVIIPLVGQTFIISSFQSPLPNLQNSPQNTTVLEKRNSVDWNQINQVVYQSLEDSYKTAQTYANHELDLWIDSLTKRIDDSFLDWYFGYFNQKQIEYKSFFTGITGQVAHLLDPNSDSPEERVAEIITENFQTEFSKRVIRPEISELRLERITTTTVKLFLKEVNSRIAQISQNYQIHQSDWKNHLQGITTNIPNPEADTSNLTLKVVSGGLTYTAFKPLIVKLASKVSSKIIVALAGKSGAKLAAKTGTVLAAKIGGAFLDATVGVGILLWDVWENSHNASIEKPVLRQNLIDYLHQVKDSLLTNPENGIMRVVEEIQGNIIRSLDLSQKIISGS